MKVLHIDTDHDAECPNQWGRWELVDFNNQNPDQFMKERKTLDEQPQPLDGGLRERLRVGLAFWLVRVGENFRIQTDFTNGRRALSGVVGLLVWAGKGKPGEPRLKDATGFVEAYNQWAAGNVIGWMVEEVGTDGTAHVAGCSGCWYLADAAADIAGALAGDEWTVEGNAAWLADDLPADVKRNRVDALACV